MGKGTTTTGELVARTGCKRELQFVLESKSEICGGESLGRTRANTRNFNVDYTSIESSRGRSGLKVGIKKIRLEKMAKRRSTTFMSNLPEDSLVSLSNLPEDSVVEILSRLPITSLRSLRSTCKQWNALSRNQIFGKVAKSQFLGFMIKGSRICSMRMDLGADFIHVSIKRVSVLNKIRVTQIYHCGGLLFCILTDKSRLLVWNPYLGQMRWIPHRFCNNDCFSFGCDNNGNHKILQILDYYDYSRTFSGGFRIYEFSSNSWKDLDVTPNCHIRRWYSDVTLKGNVYFYVQNQIIVEGAASEEFCLLCFDFTSERFGPRLSLPFGYDTSYAVMLSPVRDEQLTVVRQRRRQHRYIPMKIEIWVTNKIDYNEVLWTKWMEVNTDHYPESFFIDVENKVVVGFHIGKAKSYQSAQIFGQDGYSKDITVRVAPYKLKDNIFMLSPSCYSYVPSLVEI